MEQNDNFIWRPSYHPRITLVSPSYVYSIAMHGPFVKHPVNTAIAIFIATMIGTNPLSITVFFRSVIGSEDNHRALLCLPLFLVRDAFFQGIHADLV